MHLVTYPMACAAGRNGSGSTHAQRHVRQLAYIVSVRDGPGSLSDGLLVLLGRICASADGSMHAQWRARRLAYIVLVRDGSTGGLSDGLLISLRRICTSVDGSRLAQRLAHIAGRMPNGSHDNCLTGKIR